MLNLYVSIIIPCFNEGPTFEKSVEKIVSELRKSGKSWELIFVEDKSSDNTKNSVKKLVNKYKNTHAIYHRKNEGRGKSVSDGLKVARSEICGYLDVDLEVSESFIPLFIKEIGDGADLVVGQRFYEVGLKSLTRVIASKVYAIAVKKIVELPIVDTEAGYKFFRRAKILPILKKVQDRHWFWDTEICARAYWKGLKVAQVPVIFKKRLDKKSTVKIIPDSIEYVRSLIRLRTQSPKLNG